MITEVPTSSEFQAAGLNQLYLAWQISIRAVDEFEFADKSTDLGDTAEQEAASAEFWAKSQPALANALGLVQQAMEMSLKGRIAAVTPFLLISRDPRDWPSGADTRNVPFSDFRTLDAADLVKVHNTFLAPPLEAGFRKFWEDVRRDRNKILHSVPQVTFDPSTLVRIILTAASALFSDVRWPQRLLDMEADGRYAAYGMNSGTQNVVMQQVDIAVRHLTPTEAEILLGFDKRRRAYVCPTCYDRADHDWQEDWPKLAQLASKTPGETRLHCVVCAETTTVERSACNGPDCPGDVLIAGTCMTCLWHQDDPDGFDSGLAEVEPGQGIGYRFSYHRRTTSSSLIVCNLSNDETAKEHARLSMLAPRLTGWEKVTVQRECVVRDGLPDRKARGLGPVIGSWQRSGDGLEWQSGVDTNSPLPT